MKTTQPQQQEDTKNIQMDAAAVRDRFGDLELQLVAKDSIILEQRRMIQHFKEEIERLQEALDSRTQKGKGMPD